MQWDSKKAGWIAPLAHVTICLSENLCPPKGGKVGVRSTLLFHLPDLCFHNNCQDLCPSSLCRENCRERHGAHTKGWPWQHACADIAGNWGLNCSLMKVCLNPFRLGCPSYILIQSRSPLFPHHNVSQLPARKSHFGIRVLRYMPLYSFPCYQS